MCDSMMSNYICDDFSGNDQRGGHMYRKEDRRAPENERRHHLDIPPPSRNSLATEASNNNPTPSRASVPSPEPEVCNAASIHVGDRDMS